MLLYNSSPQSLAPGTSFLEDNFSRLGWGWGACQMIQVYYTYYVLYFYYYTVIYSEIVYSSSRCRVSESLSLFPATRWSHLGMGDSGVWSVLLMSSLLHNLQSVTWGLGIPVTELSTIIGMCFTQSTIIAASYMLLRA